MENRKLEAGEKYLSVIISCGSAQIKFAAFQNKNKKDKEPDFKGRDIAVWVSKKQGIKEEEVI